ncbi:MAG: MopE-related protein [Patescibacteria group bacterium]
MSSLLLILAACDRSTAPVVETKAPANDRAETMEVRNTALSRTSRIVITHYWWDGDRDGYGAPGSDLWATRRPRGYSPFGGDCADRDATVNPGATEDPTDGVDTDCDGTGDTADTSVTDTAVVDTGDSATTVLRIVVTRDASGGLTYPATIWAWYGSGGSASASVSASTDTLMFSPSTTDLSDHSWVDIQAEWSSGANWSDDCGGFTVTSDDHTVTLYEKTSSSGSGDTCRIYVGLAVPFGDDMGVWTAVR